MENKNNDRGTSLNFDGIDDQLIVPNYNKLKITTGTIEAWFKTSKKDSLEWHAILAKELAYEIAIFHYKPASYNWAEKQTFYFGDTMPLNEWHHMALSFRDNVDNGSQLFFDGKPIGKPFKISVLDQGSELYVGSNHFTDQYFSGNIDEVRIWNIARAPEEIYLNYNTEIDPTTKGLVLYYKFNDGIPLGDNQQSQYVKDETLNNLTGNLHKFNLKGNTSNYVNDSPLVKKNFFGISTFVIQYLWIIISVFVVILLTLLIVKIRTRLLNKENKKLEILVTQKTNELNNSLQQKEVLIQEIHHRVKNNLQFIISLIDFELAKSEMKSTAKESLQSTSRRLLAMVLVHDMLYRKDDVETISVKNYISELIITMKSIAERDISKIAFEINIDDFPLNISQCTSMGIITSEIITNCIKHAFYEIDKPRISINLKVNQTLNKVEYIIADNGVGMSMSNKSSSDGVGKKLIDVFCRQLQGNYEFSGLPTFERTLQLRAIAYF
ncbi:MAG: hypothetical protein NTZ59_12780 [Bacteroidetes bacterium]|nr:hypothetical protein [Bacteroidota bacterium]